jgi:hypothetical protein
LDAHLDHNRIEGGKSDPGYEQADKENHKPQGMPAGKFLEHGNTDDIYNRDARGRCNEIGKQSLVLLDL